LSEHKKFIILGCQRSGTTLLGMALQAHPDIELIEENNPCFHTQYALTKQINLSAVKEYSSTDRKLTGFKAPRDSHRTEEIVFNVPLTRILWISRDIYQVVASMISLRMGTNITWAIAFAPKEIIKYLYTEKSDYKIAELYQWALSQQNTRKKSIALASVCWLTKQRSERKSIARWPELISRVSYSELVSSPKDTLVHLLDFLEIDWHPAVLDHSSILSGSRPGGSTTTRSIHSDSINKWKNELSGEELKLIDMIVQVQVAG
jgi:hypothetical protein